MVPRWQGGICPTPKVNGDVLEPVDAIGAYDLEIDANEEPLSVGVSATRSLGVSVIGAAIDIVT